MKKEKLIKIGGASALLLFLVAPFYDETVKLILEKITKRKEDQK
jgi:hypothetical protein